MYKKKGSATNVDEQQALTSQPTVWLQKHVDERVQLCVQVASFVSASEQENG